MNDSNTIKAGRITIEIRGDAIDHTFDPAMLGAGVARAIADAVAAGIRGITQAAAPATLVYREKARKALASGAAWAVARFPSGRVPGAGSTLFNNSGELGASIALEPDGDAFNVTAPADRLNALPGGDLPSLLDRLRSLVPALADPFSSSSVRAAVEASWSTLVRLRRS